MRLLPLNDGHTASLFLSASELTAGRYNEFQHYLTQDAGIGSDADAVERHFGNLSARLALAETDPKQIGLAADELALLHYNFEWMQTRNNCKHLAFGVLVATVDGAPATDLSEDGLTALLARLSDYGLTQGQIETAVADFLKKKAKS